MTESSHYRMSLKYRILFYLGGLAFATMSYVAGIWAYGAESASWGDTQFYGSLLRNLLYAFSHHTTTFFVWEIVCVGIAATFWYLLDREVYYRRKAEQKANVDGLTDIFNHRYFQERLAAEIDRANRYDRTLSLIMLDLDDFKTFNDTWGHQEGDRLLKWFAEICCECIRSMDLLARYGGEEFVVVLPEADAKEALAVAERIRENTEKRSLSAFGKNRGVTVSAGVANFPTHGRNRHALVLNADAALYYAKQDGKNRCFVYQEQCHRSYRATADHVKALLSNDDLEAIEALGAVVDARDAHTRGHSSSVMRLSVDLGEKLGMSAQELDSLRTAALLHDLGKIGTPEDILGKSSPLQADEWERIENHAGLGSQILKRVQQMGAIVPGVRHHHERYDGKGYPNGLAGKNIPLLARIIAIADAYDAMTSARSYKRAKTPQEAVEELRRCAGQQFDPELVELFVTGMLGAGSDQEAA